MRLFANQGYERTTVGEIEAAAGFAARGGTLYKHFPSKEALLEAAMDQQVRAVEGTRAIVDYLPLGDLRTESTLMFRYLFDELTRHRQITALIEREGALTRPLAERFWAEIGEPGYRLGVQLLDRQLNKDGSGDWDAEALSALLVGAVVNFRRTQWTFDRNILDVDEERFVRLITRLLEALASPPTPPDEGG